MAVREQEAPDGAVAEVGVEVAAPRAEDRLAVVDEAACYRAAQAVGVLGDRERQRERAGARPRCCSRGCPRSATSRSSRSARRRGRKSTSSQASCPTSAMSRSPVRRSNENRHGFRSPLATMVQTGLAAVGFAVATSLPSIVLMSSPAPSGSPQQPPSPMLRYSLPSAPNWSWPP